MIENHQPRPPSAGGPVVTVFGGTGFVGRHLVWHLARHGAVVRIATRVPHRAKALKPAGVVGQIVGVRTSLGDDSSIADAVRGATHVVNLVGILAESGTSSFDRVHAELPGKIARAAEDKGVGSLVHVSSLGAAADAPSRYQQSKAAGEDAVHAGFPAATILRPSIVFGPEDGFFNLFANMARFLPALPLIGGGHTRFQPVYVEDVASAIMETLFSADHRGKTFELGGPQTYSFKDLLVLMMQETGQRRALLPLPWPLAELQGSVFQRLPGQLLTYDQVQSLKTDNVCSGTLPGLTDLGIEPTALEIILPTYMDRFRRGGRFAKQNARAYS